MDNRHKYDKEFWDKVTWEPHEKEELRRLSTNDAALGAFAGMCANQLDGVLSEATDEDILDQIRYNLKIRHVVRRAGL